MKSRSLIIGSLVVLCLAMVWASWSKGRQVSDLRQKQKDLLAQLSSTSEPLPAAAEQANPTGGSDTSELLRLRAEVNRLTRRKQELAAVSAENQRLKAQLVASSSAAPRAALPEGYIRKAVAQNRGYDTPQNTLETFLWALQARNLTNILDAFTPEGASMMQSAVETSGRSVEDFLRDANAMPGLRILQTETVAPDIIKALVEIAPGVRPEPMVFRQINGQWKLTGSP